MSTSDARMMQNPAKTDGSINSPPKTGKATNTPMKVQATSGTGFPPTMDAPYPNFTQVQDIEAPRGNRRYEFMMRSMGHYGVFFPTDRKANCVTPINLDITIMRAGIHTTLRTALMRALHTKGHIQQDQIANTAQQLATHLTNGCMMMLYCRLRAVNKSFVETSDAFILRPHVPSSFEIPKPYALAIQHLGLFRVENADQELEYIPTLTAAQTANYCLGTHIWSLPNYQSAVETAKSLGLTFSGVDLSVKLGSAWWLFKSVQSGANYSLQCCLPESNYTKEDTVIRALWCVTDAGSFHADIADLSQLTMDRGTFLRNPTPDIALTCFYGMMEVPEPIWGIN